MNKFGRLFGIFFVFTIYSFLYSCDKSSSKHPLSPPDDNPQTSGVPIITASGEYGVSGQNYVLNWTSVSDAKSYILQEATKITFEDSVSTSVTDTTVSITKEVQTKQGFYYRVRAINDTLSSAWSDTVSVVVYPSTLPRPVLHGPEGSIGSGDIYTLKWSNVWDSYTLEEATSIFFSDAVSYSVSDSSKVFSRFKSEGPVFCYRVRAQGIPGVINYEWSNVVSIVIIGKIVYTLDINGLSKICTMIEDGTNQKILTNNTLWNYDPSWSPDGTEIIYVMSNQDPSSHYIDPNQKANICIMNSDGTNLRNLINFDSYPWNFIFIGNITRPSFVPNGIQVGFSALLYAVYMDYNIYTVNIDGGYGELGELVDLTKNSKDIADMEPSWSPDGTQIAFVHYSEIYVMNTNGSNQQQLTNNTSEDSNPSWSPDGTQIVFETGMGGNREIYVMNADGSNQRNLTNSLFNEYDPSWSHDGEQILFTSFRYGDSVLMVMNADGSNQRNIAISDANFSQPSWCPK